MKSSRGWGDVIWGKVSLVVATVVLAVSSAVGGAHRPWLWIIASGTFMIVHTGVNAGRDRSLVRRLGWRYDTLQQRALQLVFELGQLTADRYDLWMIGVYLPAWQWSLTKAAPFLHRKEKLSRQVSVALIHDRQPPSFVPLASGPYGKSFSTPRAFIWFDRQKHQTSSESPWHHYDAAAGEHEELGHEYGVLTVSPLVDEQGRNCVGVLAVHVRPDREVIVQALGALQSEKGCHHINTACVALNSLLRG